MTVIPMVRPALKLDRSPMPQTRVLSTDARLAFSSLEGRIGALRRCFAGAFVTESQAATIAGLIEDARADLQKLYRLTR